MEDDIFNGRRQFSKNIPPPTVFNYINYFNLMDGIYKGHAKNKGEKKKLT